MALWQDLNIQVTIFVERKERKGIKQKLSTKRMQLFARSKMFSVESTLTEYICLPSHSHVLRQK
uniref:Uncharacterized protein n=1 Tax=Anguilla anguilla TaxID=7936 RepID=A0A0E9S3E6_ANGAN